MNRLNQIVPCLCFLLVTFVFTNAESAVTVTPASGTCLNVAPGGYLSIGDIIFNENNNGDFATGTNVTLLLSAPANFNFQAGVGTVSYTNSRNFTSASIVVTATTITVTYTISGTNKDDRLTISGINVRSTLAGSSGQILRTGGTGSIGGDVTGAGVNHGDLSTTNSGITITSAANGNWSSGSTWVGGIPPSCLANAKILHNVTVDVAADVTDLTINNGGVLTATNDVTVNGTFTMAGNGSYIHNNTSNVSTTIFKGTESFASTTSITILKWYNTGVPFATYVTGSFGSITFDQRSAWSQDGVFSPARIKGTLTVSSGQITMDDGTGMTTVLTLQDVVINGSGTLRMATGTNRNLTLTTGNYSDTRVGGSSYSGVQFNCAGSVSWTINGNFSTNTDWSYFEGTGTTAGNSTVNITGNFLVYGGKFDLNRNVDANLTLVVGGNITINGSPGWVRFLDRNNGILNATSQNVYINGGSANTFMGGSSPNGAGTFNITNDLEVNNIGTTAYFLTSTTNASSLTVTVGHDLTANKGSLYIANSNANTTLNVGRNLNIIGSNGLVIGQSYTVTNKPTTVNITGSLIVSSGDFFGSQAVGNFTLSVVETVQINSGRIFGIFNAGAANNGAAVLTCNDLDFNGGTFVLFNSKINDGKTIQANINNDITVDFASATDVFSFINLTGTNNPILDLNVTNNITVSGNFPGSYFISSTASGNETVDVGGNVTVNAGDVFFVGNESSLIATHNIITNIGGNLTINGGNTRLSTGVGTATVTVSGNTNITGGTLNLKYDTGVATMNIFGSYTQSAGTFNLHSRTTNTANVITVNLSGDFTMSNGTLNFDTQSSGAGLAEHQFNMAGANYTLSGSALITHANDLSSNYIFGFMNFTRSGTTNYLRNSSTTEIKHIKYQINSGTTVDATASPNDFEMTSFNSATLATSTALYVTGTLNMGAKTVISRQQAAFYSGVEIKSGGRYRTSHTGGLYSGSNIIPCSINGYISGANNVNYSLDANSTVEYYGTATSAITGIPNGIATGTAQKYGKLEINFTGAAGSTWVYPETNNELFIRTSLILTNGELNLDNNHVTTNGGRAITVETGGTITRTNGFIRSETEDGTARLRWTITANGTYVIPFGYDAASYIPFTYQQTSGSSGLVSLATYRTAVNNTPLPPTVTHVRNVSGADNSANTVDRFWYITVGTPANANITFSYVSTEGTGIVAPRAQRWEPVSKGWFPPIAGQSNPTATTTLVGPIANFATWWTLAAGSSPLPIELVAFDAKKSGKEVNLSWTTSSEINNDYFTIERAANGIDFEKMFDIDGAGNSTSTLSYFVIDKTPLSGANYYRLMQTDYDGNSTYSAIRTVNFNENGHYSVYPNPVTTKSDIIVKVPTSGTFKVNIFDSSGRLIYSSDEIADEDNSIVVKTENLNCNSGIYQLLVTGAQDQFALKLMFNK